MKAAALRAIAAVAVATIAVFSAGVAGAAPPSEAYPPHDVILQLQGVPCIQPSGDAIPLNGTVDGFLLNSSITITATLNGAPFGGPVVVTVDASFHASFSVPIPAGTQGSLVVTATGIKADTKQQFSASASILLVLCVLPPTGTGHAQQWVSYGGLAVLAGIFLVVAARRRRHHAGVAS